MPTNTSIPRITEIAATLRELTAHYGLRIQQIDAALFAAKPRADKWSKKEVLGHLIDSAENNLRRFITAQYEPSPPHIVYNQDFWVAANHYNQVATNDLIMLWKLLNERLAVVMETLPESSLGTLCNTGKGGDEFHTLHFLAADYVAHTAHHLEQIIS